jgi:RNA recognition motif-containing protein
MAQNGQEGEHNPDAASVTQGFMGIPTRNNEAALFVGGLSFSATEEDLRSAFGTVGNIVSVRIVQDRDTGKPRGFAFVNFETPESVDTAIRECQGMELCGRNVRLDRSAAGVVGRGKGKGGHYMHYHHGAEFGMYPGGYRPQGAPIYPPMMPHHFAPMYPNMPFGFTAPAPPAAPQGTDEEGTNQHQQSMSGPPPPPPPPPQFMYHPMVGHAYHPMLGIPAFPPQAPAPPAPPAPPSANGE